ncbi:hypothetical protein [Mycoplasmopsis cynos]|uniref:Uncharacterized protein n=2 Tax=Mycoplasmopsis cynos TaxID=171284 RepID=L0RW99_MYCC1|nr:hypothetical protein [Mycoplasmopsis cynos]CCP24422.1 Hypothetical protein MCYN_0690 [Mycoplasmopsis cynos C142]UWV92467.1 hypothetical protein NWE57_06500 [Mycoplasmopsis cynos]WQQ13211.1 hypothetical protein RRG58_00470 [Mycoplasmopsis cynos]WQQ13898.1 hypothetical protein RRG52_04050 [Mycoplasmopsis cynos]WQQ14749.1 hypothetical protein RRG42_00175 [Mycoplasmopsis cynos]
MKKKALLIQILEVKNIFYIFNDLEYPCESCDVEEYRENLYDTVSLSFIF